MALTLNIFIVAWMVNVFIVPAIRPQTHTICKVFFKICVLQSIMLACIRAVKGLTVWLCHMDMKGSSNIVYFIKGNKFVFLTCHMEILHYSKINMYFILVINSTKNNLVQSVSKTKSNKRRFLYLLTKN